MMAVSHQCINTFIWDMVLDTFSIIAGIALGRNTLLATSPVSYFTPRIGHLSKLGHFGGRRLFISAHMAIVWSFGF
jgi:hypothetical protein